MEDFKNILLEGEEVLWSAKPDWALAKPWWRYWTRRWVAFLFATAFFVAAYFFIKESSEAGGIISSIFGVFAFSLMFVRSPEEARNKDEGYAVTNIRLIIIREGGFERYSAALSALTAFQARKNGKVTDLTIRTGAGEDDYVTLFALTDSAAAEALIAANLPRGKNQ